MPFKAKILGVRSKFGSFFNPILILQLVVDGNSKSTSTVPANLLQFVCHTTLSSSDANVDSSTLIISESLSSSSSLVENFKGTKCKSPILARDPVDSKMKLFFVFPDLAIRVSGTYRVVCRIFDISKPDQVVKLLTDEFTVYSARSFTGYDEATTLTRALSLQGFVPLVRKYNRSYSLE